MKILIATFFLILVATAAVAQPPAAWKSYTVKGEAFSVVFPTLPAMATNEEFIDRFGKFRRQRLLGAYAEGLVYTASCYLNPKQELLEDFIEQEIFTHSTFDRTSEKDLKRNGISGKQYVAPDKVPGTVQFFSSLVLGKSASGIEVTDGLGIPYESGPITQTDWSTQKPIVGKQADRKTAVIMKPEPMYTEEARKKGTTGTVVLKVVFFSDGSVGKINTIADLPYGLTEKAIEAAKKIKFIPAMKEGKFVSMWMQLEYYFNLY
jgi:TonB family protein